MGQTPVVLVGLLLTTIVGVIATPTPNAASLPALLVKHAHSMCAVASLGFVE